MNDFFKKNRKKLSAILDEDSIVVLFSGKAPFKVGDERYKFSPNRNMYYMTGIDKENVIFIMYKDNSSYVERLYIERQDELKEKWTGKIITDTECKHMSGIQNIKYLDEFKEDISNIIFLKRIQNFWLDMEKRDIDFYSPAINFANEIKSNYPYIQIKDIYPIISEFRMIKSKYEIDLIRKAVEITGNAIADIMQFGKPGQSENVLEAFFNFSVKASGVKEYAFSPIIASGKNATILHYTDNDCIINDGDLILADVGVQCKYYNADLTRTFPANGKFTQDQRIFYSVVLQGQRRVIEAIKPGVEFSTLNEILKDFYFKRLEEMGIVEEMYEVENYYYHNVSHFLGLETHDVGRNHEGKLKSGMVLTVEPGLYIPERGIGIRIEDDVVVTRNGCEVLSQDVIRTADDIEDFIRYVRNRGVSHDE